MLGQNFGSMMRRKDSFLLCQKSSEVIFLAFPTDLRIEKRQIIIELRTETRRDVCGDHRAEQSKNACISDLTKKSSGTEAAAATAERWPSIEKEGAERPTRVPSPPWLLFHFPLWGSSAPHKRAGSAREPYCDREPNLRRVASREPNMAALGEWTRLNLHG